MNIQGKWEFLKKHERYYTMRSWNRVTSFAANVKVYNFVPDEYLDKAYEMVEQSGAYGKLRNIIRKFDEKYHYRYQIVFNGCSGGYMTLVNGGIKEDRIYRNGHGIGEDLDEIDLEIEGNKDYILELYRLVKDFDGSVERCKRAFINMLKNYNVIEKTVLVEKTVKTLEKIKQKEHNGITE